MALVIHGDVRTLPLPDASVDAIVCDPPYGLEFMGKDWDSFKPAVSRGPGGTFAKGTVGGFTGKDMPRHGKRWRLKRCVECGHVQGGASP